MIAIALDGPAGAGKSTIARTVAKQLGFIYIDTGALYRTIGLAATAAGTDTDNAEAVAALLDSLSIQLTFRGDEQRVLLNGEDVSDRIRTPEASMMASKVSAIPAVRTFLLSLQRKMAEENNVIMDGRDIGTVVLPNAQIKLFLTASVECRAQRRYEELIGKGMDVKLEDVKSDMEKRDYADSHLATAPLKPAEDAQIVDTSWLELHQSVALLTEIINHRLNG
ncbi:MAG: (d)CMP kinase [Clostridia bacterium]|nr:(d)CMP kinase [Clostridia bacterium]